MRGPKGRGSVSTLCRPEGYAYGGGLSPTSRHTKAYRRRQGRVRAALFTIDVDPAPVHLESVRMKTNRIATFGSVCLLLAVTAAAQARQAPATLSHELLWSFQRVGAPDPSPDGKWVVFSVVRAVVRPVEGRLRDLWVVPADGSSRPRRLTSSKGSESGPAWSADSTRIAFAAKRDDDEVNQIYVLDVVRGGEAQRVTAAPTAASVPRWSPDGQRILFQAAMWPGATDEETNRKAAQERKNAKSKVRIYDSFPIKNFDRWIEESKSHLWVVDVAGDRKARSLFADSKVAATPASAVTRCAVWSPDGQSVVFVATENDGIAARANVRVAPLAGGRERRRADAADA